MASVPKLKAVEAGFRLVVAGGGTGGHLFPGIAVAQAFVARHRHNLVLFINSGRPLETEVLSRLGWPHRVIAIEGIKGRGLWRQFLAAVKVPRAVIQSVSIFREFRPDVVLGVGGYSAGPTVMAAWMMGIRTALHEQNQLPGLTNRLLRRIVDRIYLTFKDDARRFDVRRTLVTGNPVRDEIVILGSRQKPAPGPGFRVLIVGGSQGAQAINRAMADALPRLAEVKGVEMVHQTGPEDEVWMRRTYQERGVPARVQSFYNDMAALYNQADLIICRAGATTVAEITTIGKAAVFIPFPHAADDHQTGNARALVAAGAAMMIPQDELDGKRLADTIITLMRDRRLLERMADHARSLGRPEAAVTIVNDIYRLMQRNAEADGH